MKVLIVGGAGYIGGTTAHLFKEAGHQVVVLDNLSTGHKHNIPDFELVEGNAGDEQLLTQVFAKHKFDAVLDFAAKIRVEESMTEPKLYFTNNTVEALRLIDAAVQAGVKNLIFSSTAAVYGNPEKSPVDESMPTGPLSPYGMSKFMAECLLRSYGITHNLNWTAFRYFNAAGAYHRIGPEYPFRTHLIPSILYAQLHGQTFEIFGDHYETPDGTCVRDYIHVADVARAHVVAAEQMVAGKKVQRPVNLGTSKGSSVLEVLAAVEKVSGQPVKQVRKAARAGDAAAYFASNKLAKELFGWEPEKDLETIIDDALAWQKRYQP